MKLDENGFCTFCTSFGAAFSSMFVVFYEFIPSSQGWGVRSFHLDSTRFFFFFGAFLFVIVLFLYELKKRTRPASSYGHVESLHV